MLGLSEWLIVLIIILALIGGPKLVRELGVQFRKTRIAVESVKKGIGVIKTDIQESAQEIIMDSADPLRVFVCSMQEETASERSAIQDRLRQLGKMAGLTRPILFEQIPASPDTPEEVYREAVERCDIFVIIVAEDISAPVLREYKYAVEYKKPRFLFRKNTPNQSDAVRRFLADVSQKWVLYHDTNELSDQVVAAIVYDLVRNYRQHRMTAADISALLMISETLTFYDDSGQSLKNKISEFLKDDNKYIKDGGLHDEKRPSTLQLKQPQSPDPAVLSTEKPNEPPTLFEYIQKAQEAKRRKKAGEEFIKAMEQILKEGKEKRRRWW